MKRILTFIFLVILLGCNKSVKQQDDELYSRHLQRKVKLTVISTPMSSDKSELNLLFLNDGQEVDKLHLKEILDSLYKTKAIEPLVVVCIHTADRMQEYGVAGRSDYLGRGSAAEKYKKFVDDELYFYAKKKAGVRKFKQVAIAGCSLGGLSALDIGWEMSDKIDKVGIFSGSLWWRDKDIKDSSYSDDKNRILFSKLKASRKTPSMQFWFYAGGAEENSDRDNDGITDVIDDTKDMIELLKTFRKIPGENITYKENPAGKHDWQYWSQVFPEFLVWAFGKNR